MAQDLTESLAPTKPSLPPQLKSLVTAPYRDAFGPYGYEPVELPWYPPEAVTADQEQAVRAILPAYDAYLKPPSIPWLSGRAATLMAHYFTPDMPQALAGAVLNDWVDIIGDLPQHAIAEACQKWLRTEPRKRPGPGDIRELALRLVEREMTHAKRLRALLNTQPQASNILGGTFRSNR